MQRPIRSLATSGAPPWAQPWADKAGKHEVWVRERPHSSEQGSWGKTTKQGARQGHRSAPAVQQVRLAECVYEDQLASEASKKQRPMRFSGLRRETWGGYPLTVYLPWPECQQAKPGG